MADAKETKDEAPKKEAVKKEAPKKEAVKKEEEITLSKSQLQNLLDETVNRAKTELRGDMLKEVSAVEAGLPEHDTSEKLSEPILFVSEKQGLKIVITPKKQHRDRNGNVVAIKGEYIHFVEGRYYARTKKSLEKIRSYMKTNKGIFEFTNEDQEFMLKLSKAENQGGHKFKAMKNATGIRRGRQGSVG